MSSTLIICDASPIIALFDIGALELLNKLYERVIIPDLVLAEIKADLPDWIHVSDQYDLNQLRILQLEVDVGEASAIALALEKPNAILVIDERKGRSIAKRLGLHVIGTLAVLVKAKDQGLIVSGEALLTQLEKHGFWLSTSLKKQMLNRFGE